MPVELRVVGAMRGWDWLVEGLALFRRSPGNWLAITLLLGMLWFASLFIPVLGPLLFNLFSPVLFAGIMIGCRGLEEGKPLEVGTLFAAFKGHAGPLVTVGGVYLVGTVVVLGIVLVAAGGAMLPAVLKSGGDIDAMRAAVRSLAIALAVGAALYLPLIMLVWFAPPLVVFGGMAPIPAMKLSFEACLRNPVPFLVYGLVILGIWIVLSAPAGLGVLGTAPGVLGTLVMVALLFLSMPVLFCSVWASYKDIFQPGRGAADGGNPFLR